MNRSGVFMDSNQKNIIIGSATGYKPELISDFINSLNKTDFKGILFLIIYAEQLKEYEQAFSHIERFKVNFKVSNIGKFKSKSKYSGLYRFKNIRNIVKQILNLTVSENNTASKIRGLKIVGYPHVSRFFEYQEILKSDTTIQNVLLTDVRDVFFQSNPFENIEKGLFVGMENPAFSIETEEYNKKWIIDAYGIDFYNEVKTNQVSCSGVTIGDYQSIDTYVDKMIEEFCKQPYKKMSERIYDQAMHNKLLLCKQLETVHYCQPFKSRIVTLGLYPFSQILMNSTGLIVDVDNQIISIVHQHDRHPEILKGYEHYLKVS